MPSPPGQTKWPGPRSQRGREASDAFHLDCVVPWLSTSCCPVALPCNHSVPSAGPAWPQLPPSFLRYSLFCHIWGQGWAEAALTLAGLQLRLGLKHSLVHGRSLLGPGQGRPRLQGLLATSPCLGAVPQAPGPAGFPSPPSSTLG